MSSRTRARAADEGLPPLGEWDGPIHGELGVLAVEGDRVQCHACGDWYKSLGHHVVLAHRVSADEYRAIFGLRLSTGLIGPALQEQRRRQSVAQLRGHYGHLRTLTPEQRAAISSRGKLRLESRKDPQNQAMYARRTANVRRRVAAGEIAQLGTYERTARHRHTAEERAKISAGNRDRTKEHATYRRIKAALAALGPAARQDLPPDQHLALELHYGLTPEGVVHTQIRIGARLGVSRHVVARLVRKAVTRLLGPQEDAGRARVPCVACGQPFVSLTGRGTCSDACERERRRRAGRARHGRV